MTNAIAAPMALHVMLLPKNVRKVTMSFLGSQNWPPNLHLMMSNALTGPNAKMDRPVVLTRPVDTVAVRKPM